MTLDALLLLLYYFLINCYWLADPLSVLLVQVVGTLVHGTSAFGTNIPDTE